MKKYFAKYFLDPTMKKQSDLKDGDIVMWKNEIHKFHSDAGYGCKTYTEYNEENGSSLIVNWSNVRGKVKLFLCSKDIQIGDTVKSLLADKSGYIDNHMNTTPEELKQSILDGDFKVIGEISPEATWVKEGDEFD